MPLDLDTEMMDSMGLMFEKIPQVSLATVEEDVKEQESVQPMNLDTTGPCDAPTITEEPSENRGHGMVEIPPTTENKHKKKEVFKPKEVESDVEHLEFQSLLIDDKTMVEENEDITDDERHQPTPKPVEFDIGVSSPPKPKKSHKRKLSETEVLKEAAKAFTAFPVKYTAKIVVSPEPITKRRAKKAKTSENKSNSKTPKTARRLKK